MDTTRDTLLPIGSFAQASGLSLKALRLYDQLGILPASYADPDSGYRYYHPDQVPTARRIRLMRSMDMPLALIGDVLRKKSAEAQAVVLSFCREREQALVRVRAAASELRHILAEGNTIAFEVQTREMPAVQIVSITRRVTTEALGQYISGSLLTLSGFVQTQGGTLCGAPFGIYHGPVDHTDDGPLEVCFPVCGAFQPEGDIAVKELPPAQAAVVRVTGEECEFPAIIGVYDAAHDWIMAHGFLPDGPPREIWNGPDERGIMEIAWPFTSIP
jgi:DNA-binding transcriptional MerR regulator